MYIDQIEIDRVKQSHDLVEVIRSYGVELKPKGKQFVGRCPFHSDKTPSLFVDPIKQLWNCLGACSEGGDIYKWVMKKEGISFPEAHKKLGGNTINNISAPAVGVIKMQWLERAVSHYQKRLLENPSAQRYLKFRGLADSSLVAAFQIGFSDGSLMETLSEEGKEALTQIGMITKSGRELMQGCLIFPLKDADSGHVVSLYGRNIKRKLHLYLPGPRRGIFNPEGAKNTDTVILTESVIDAAALWHAGFVNTIPIYGINGLTEELILHLLECRIRRVVLMLDMDEAGQGAIGPIAARLSAHPMQVRSVMLPNKDAAEFFAKSGKAEQVHVLLDQVQWEGVTPVAATIVKNNGTPSQGFCIADNDGRNAVCDPPVSQKESPSLIDLLQTAGPDGAIHLSFSSRAYRIMGLSPTGLDRLRVNLRLSVNTVTTAATVTPAAGGTPAAGVFHIDSLDLYQARGRDAFAQRAAKQTGFAENEIAQDLLEMIEPLEAARLFMRKEGEKPKPIMTQPEKDEAMVLLRATNLIEQIVSDITACGFIGEAETVLATYLAATSRKLPKPLSVLVIARSGAGKSSLQDAIVGLMPSEDVVKVTRLTGQALYYKGEGSLKHKVLSIAEMDGASQAEYSLRTLISDQYLAVEATHTDPKTGKLRTSHYENHGPTSVFTSTISPEAFEEETRNRFMLMTMNESIEQTEAILAQQRNRHTTEGMLLEARAEQIQKRHQNMQRLILPLRVHNPYIHQLRYPKDRLVSRREQDKYLTLINTIALLHQHQRPIKRTVHEETEAVTTAAMEYVEVMKSDIALANRLAHAILWRSFDEMAPPVRAMHTQLMTMFIRKAKEKKGSSSHMEITRREIRKVTGWSEWQVKTYCRKLVEMEYLYLVPASLGKPSVYKLACSIEEEGRPSLEGLIDADELK